MDSEQTELAFPPTLTGYVCVLIFLIICSHQRKMVHHIAYNLQLFHFSVGDGDNRYITVSKRPVQISLNKQHRHQASAVPIPSSRGARAHSKRNPNPTLSQSAPATSHDSWQPIVFRSHAFRKDMPHVSPQHQARTPDGYVINILITL